MPGIITLPSGMFASLRNSFRHLLRRKKSTPNENTAMNATPEIKSDKCYLLELPAEIRNCIYEYVLPDSFPIILLSDRRKTRTYRGACQPPLTRVSKQLRRETLPMFYNSTPFCFIAPPIRPDSKKQLKAKALAPLAPHMHFIKRVKIEIRYPGFTSPVCEVFIDFNKGIMYARLTDSWILHNGHIIASHALAARLSLNLEATAAEQAKLEAAKEILLTALSSGDIGGGVSVDEMVQLIQILRASEK